MKLGAVILAGGKGRRMREAGGECAAAHNKALMRFGKSTFLERLIGELGSFEEILISIDIKERFPNYAALCVEDEYPDCGPMGGLYSALKNCRSDALFAAACDMPLLTRAFAEYMAGYLCSDFDAYVAVSRDGRVHPLCGIYKKSATDTIQKQVVAGNYKMMHLLQKLRYKEVKLEHTAFPDDIVSNINTPDQYAALCWEKGTPPVACICGMKNAGKTTLMEGLIRLFTAKGMKVGAVKHDGHDFVPDVPGTDSYRLSAAGAVKTAIYSSARYMLTERKGDMDISEILPAFRGMDIILVEGGKNMDFPRVEVVRHEISPMPVSKIEGLVAYCSDIQTLDNGIPAYPLSDYEGIAKEILRVAEKDGRTLL